MLITNSLFTVSIGRVSLLDNHSVVLRATEGMKENMVKELGSEVCHPWAKLDISVRDTEIRASSLGTMKIH